MLYPLTNFAIPSQKLKKALQVKVHNKFIVALDAASVTGWAISYFSKGVFKFYVGQFKVYKNSLVEQLIQLSITYKYIFNRLKSRRSKILILEDTHLGVNAHTYGFLSRLGGFIEGFLYYDFDQRILLKPAHARKVIGIKGNAKKELVVSHLNQLLGIKLRPTDHNIADAIVLALSYFKESVG